MENKSKVLVDLSVSYLSNSGIPLDAKWLFKQLMLSNNLDVYGLIYPLDWKNYDFHIDDNETALMLKYSQYLTYFDNSPSSPDRGSKMPLGEFRKKFSLYKKIYLKSKFTLWEKKTEKYNDVIFRNFFEGGLGPKDRELIERGKYIFTDFFKHSLFSRLLTSLPVRLPYIDTSEYDYIIHQDSVAVEVSKNTQKIIRYHDPIPLLSPDLTQDSFLNATYHYKSIEKCIEQGAIYVCNSEPVEEELLELFPALKGRTTTIPYTILDLYNKTQDFDKLFEILETKSSHLFSDVMGNWKEVFNKSKLDPKSFRYITEVSTIEPRKNYVKLIKAFTAAKSKLFKENINLKLVIAGSLGWKNENIIKMLKPLVASGDALLLENCHPQYLVYLYSHADAFMFPTLKEGFGLPPVEAMLCKTPVISSDIKVHRWVQGESSFYVDPYDYQDIAKNIEYIVLNRESSEVKDRIEKGIVRAQRYNFETNRKKWDTLFSDIKLGKYKVK